MKTDQSGGAITKNYSGIDYTGINLEAIYHAEGRCTPQPANTWRYEYNIRDHLANTRITFADLDNSGTVTTLEILQFWVGVVFISCIWQA